METQISHRALLQHDGFSDLEHTTKILVRPSPACIHDDGAHPLGILDPYDLPDCTAGRMADQMRAVDTERVHDAEGVGGHALDAVLHLLMGTRAGTAVIVDDHLEMRAQWADLRLPIAASTAKAISAHHIHW